MHQRSALFHREWRVRYGFSAFLRASALPWFLTLLWLLVSVLLYPGAGEDDGYITFWAAENLFSERGIVNYNGEPFEQSSSLLFTLVLAVFCLPIPLPTEVCARLLSYLCAALVVGRTLRIAGQQKNGFLSISCAFALLLTSADLLYWAGSGMEATMTALAALFFVEELFRKQRPGVLLSASAALILVRPEGAIVAAGILTGLIAVSFVPSYENVELRIVCAKVLAFVVVFTAAVAGVRMLYFGSPVPNPMLVKGRGHFDLIGTRSFLDRFYPFCLVLALLPVALGPVRWVFRRDDGELLLAISGTVLAYTAFCYFTGGDWMEGNRFFVPAIPLAALSIGITFSSQPRKAIAITVVGVVLGLYGIATFTWPALFDRKLSPWLGGQLAYRKHAMSSPVWEKVEFADLPHAPLSFLERRNVMSRAHAQATDALAVDIASRCNSGRVKIASMQMGYLPYHLNKEFPGCIDWVDMLSLTEDRLMLCADYREKTVAGSAGRGPLPPGVFAYIDAVAACADPDYMVVLWPKIPSERFGVYTEIFKFFDPLYYTRSFQLRIIKKSRVDAGSPSTSRHRFDPQLDLSP